MHTSVLRVVHLLNAICVSQVYYPNLGWMCVDATDPEKGNWLRYINWARSGKEQNLFPLEINRTIYYKSLKPIAPGEELLVWYNGEDDPEIAAAIEEERASARSRRHSPKAKKDQVEDPAGSSSHVGPFRNLMERKRLRKVKRERRQWIQNRRRLIWILLLQI